MRGRASKFPNRRTPRALERDQGFVDDEVGESAVVDDLLDGGAELRQQEDLADHASGGGDLTGLRDDGDGVIRMRKGVSEPPEFVVVPHPLEDRLLARREDGPSNADLPREKAELSLLEGNEAEQGFLPGDVPGNGGDDLSPLYVHRPGDSFRFDLQDPVFPVHREHLPQVGQEDLAQVAADLGIPGKGFGERILVERPLDPKEDLLLVERLADELVHALPEPRHGLLPVTEEKDRHQPGVRVASQDLDQSFGREDRDRKVQQEDIRFPQEGLRERLAPVRRLDDLKPLFAKIRRQRLPGLVGGVGDQDALRPGGRGHLEIPLQLVHLLGLLQHRLHHRLVGRVEPLDLASSSGAEKSVGAALLQI